MSNLSVIIHDNSQEHCEEGAKIVELRTESLEKQTDEREEEILLTLDRSDS